MEENQSVTQSPTLLGEKINSFKNKKARVHPQLIIIGFLVLVLIIGLIFLSFKLKKDSSSGLKEIKNGVFTSFSATATGVITSLTDTHIQIEQNGEKRTFKLSKNVLITYIDYNDKTFIQQILDILIPEVNAQQIPPRPAIPQGTIDTKNTSTNSGLRNTTPIPPRPGISVSDKEVKVGDKVTLTLTKYSESEEWTVVYITILNQ